MVLYSNVNTFVGCGHLDSRWRAREVLNRVLRGIKLRKFLRENNAIAGKNAHRKNAKLKK
jgi:hypothetical protein